MKTKQYFVYILTNQKNTTLYTGVTNDLVRRIYLHKQKVVKGFTHKYNLAKLIYYENHNNVLEAIKREKKLKKWSNESILPKAHPRLKRLLVHLFCLVCARIAPANGYRYIDICWLSHSICFARKIQHPHLVTLAGKKVRIRGYKRSRKSIVAGEAVAHISCRRHACLAHLSRTIIRDFAGKPQTILNLR